MRSRNPAVAVLGVLITLIGLLMVIVSTSARADEGRPAPVEDAVVRAV
jgi:hypothetical protein